MVILLVAGIFLSLSVLTYLIDRRETSILLSYDMDRSALLANDIARKVRELMIINKRPTVIRQMVVSHSVPGEIQTALFRADGTLYAGETEHRVPADMFLSPRNISFRDNSRCIFFEPLLNEESCQKCHAPDKPLLGVLMVNISSNKIISINRDLLKNMISFTLLIAVISSGLLIVLLRRKVFKPLAVLSEGVEKISSGDYHHRVLMPDKDEFGRLASTFNQMAESIENSYLTLERAVQQRTTELEVVANLSIEVFRGDRPFAESIAFLLQAIIDKLGFRYTSLCLIDRETGLLSEEFIKGSDESFCLSAISLLGDHPLASAILKSRPVLINAAKMGFSRENPYLMVIPIISHQRRKCWEVNLCSHETCPAFGSIDERCWLIEGTMCRSRQAIIGKDKLYGCIHCQVFPIYGVLLAETDNLHMLTDSTLHSLEILAADIAAALETHRLIDEKKEDIVRLIRLHDLSIQKMTTLDMPSLMNFIVTSIIPFAHMQAALLWMKKEDALHFSGSFVEDPGTEGDNQDLMGTGKIPPVIPIDDSLIGRSIVERRPIESINPQAILSLETFILENSYKYAISIPLVFREEVQGCITLFKKTDFFMTDSEKAVIALFASQASAAMHTMSLYADLRTSEKKYRSLMNEASDGIVLLDTDNRIIEANSRAAAILGYPENSILGRTYTSFVHEDQTARTADAIHKILSSGPGSLSDLLIVKQDGSQAFIDVSASAISVSDRRIIQAIFRDTTERKKMEMVLQTLIEKVYGASSELFLRSLALSMAKSLDMAFVMIGELTSDNRHIRTVAVCSDNRIIDNFEYAIQGTPCSNIVAKELCLYPAGVQALFPESRMLADMGAESYIGIPLFDFEGQPLGLIAALDRKPLADQQLSRFIVHMYAVRAAAEMKRMKSDKLLQAEKDFSEAIFESTASGIMVVDRKGHILKINSSGAEILGTSIKDMLGEELASLHPEMSMVLSLEPSLGQEVVITTSDNRIVPIGFTSSLLPGSHGHTECIIVLFRDLSEIKKLQNDLRKKEYFETMGKVVAGVAHEVRNPLFGISSIGQILERENNIPQHQALISAMLRECDRMKNLIEELLLYTRPARLDIQDIDIGLLFLELEHHTKGKKDAIKLSVEIPPSLTISADRDKITQVLLNVLNNAIEAARTCVTVTARQNSDQTEIRIKDDGPGIPQKYIEKIFEPFFTTKKGGTGLGLPICRKLMEDHGGSLEILSQENRGTEVILRLQA